MPKKIKLALTAAILFSLFGAGRKGLQCAAPEVPLVQLEDLASKPRIAVFHRGGGFFDYIRMDRVSKYSETNQLDALLTANPIPGEFYTKFNTYLHEETIFKARKRNPDLKDFPLIQIDADLFSSTGERQLLQLAASHHHETYGVPVTAISFHSPAERNDLAYANEINAMFYTNMDGVTNELYEVENPRVVNLDRVQNQWNARRCIALLLADPGKISVGDWVGVHGEKILHSLSPSGWFEDKSEEAVWANRISSMTIGCALTDFRYETLTPLLDLMPDQIRESDKFKKMVFWCLRRSNTTYLNPPLQIRPKDNAFLEEMTGMTYKQGIQEIKN